MVRTWAAGVILGLVAIGAVHDAHADRAVVAVGALASDSPGVPAGAAEAARAATRSAQWTIEDGVSAAKQREALECLEDTKTAGPCVKRVFEDVNAEVDRVILVAASGGGRGQPWELVGYVFRTTGDELATSQRYCESCDDGQLAEDVRALTTELVRSAQATASPSRLIVTSTPTNAEVLLDDQPIGATELDYKPFAGPHTVEVRKTGYKTEIRQIVIGAGERVVLDFPLTPDKGGSGGGGGTRIGPWFVVGLGAAAVVTGGVLIAIDEDAGSGDRRSREYNDTALVGVGAVCVGAAAVGVGVWWLLRDGGKPPAATAVAPVAGWDGTSAFVGATGSF